MSHEVKSFDGGFLTYGRSVSYSDEHLGEGEKKESLAGKQIAFAALPDESTVLCIQYAKALNRVFLAEVSGVFWNIPNDIFNSCERSFAYEKGECKLRGGSYANKFETVPLGHYVSVDGAMGVASFDELTLIRRGRRQVEIKGRPKSGTLYCEEITSSYKKEVAWHDRGEVLVDTSFAIALGGAEETEKMYSSLFTLGLDGLKSVGVEAKNGKKYALVANFSDTETVADLGNAKDAVKDTSIGRVTLAPGEAVLVELQ